MAAVETANKSELLAKLKKQLANIEPLEDEKDFFEKDETLLRFLKARDWDVKEAEKQLLATIEWRREKSPLTMDCRWCHETPGYHSMRQVGFDEVGRPVIYSCFSQAETHKNIPEDSIAHCTYLIENATRSMKPGVTTWVFIIDCTGMTLPCCNPKLGRAVTQIMGNYFPERLGQIIVLNHSSLFHGIWQALKVFIDTNTVNKMIFVRSKEKMQKHFQKYFDEELCKWLTEEIQLNKAEPLSEGQQRFWEPPLHFGKHDPRGVASYVERYIDPYFITSKSEQAVHKPHPNIVDHQLGSIKPIVVNNRKKKNLTKKIEKRHLEKYGITALSDDVCGSTEEADKSPIASASLN